MIFPLKTAAMVFRLHTAAAIIFAASLCLSCTDKEEASIEDDVKSFVCAYFNFHYSDALNLCTPESHKWIKFQASNITQADIDVVNNQTDSAECEIASVDKTSDSTAIVHVNVKNFLFNDSIGKPATIHADASFSFLVCRQANRWKVRLSSLPKIEEVQK